MSPPCPLATMAAHLPRLPVFVFLLLVFLSIHVPASHGSPPPLPYTYEGSICSESFMCGSVNISYPFYLSNSTKETTDHTSNYSCGYTDLEIQCRGEGPTATPVMNLGGFNYNVLNITYDSQTIVVANGDVISGGICPAVSHNVSYDDVWLHNGSSNEILAFFFGCYKVGRVPPEFQAYQIKCPEFNNSPGTGGGYSFVVTPDERDENKELEQELAAKCRENVTVPVMSDVLRMASAQSNFTTEGYGWVLQHGFELTWNWTNTDSCYPCEQSRGKCAYSETREFLACVCNGGKVGDPDCNHIIRKPSKPF